jgi:hypothetical protein
MIDVIRYSSDCKNQEGELVEIFGKFYGIPAVSNAFRIIVHPDFPMVTQEDIENFISASTRSEHPTVSCRKVRVHPYRLMVIGDNGYDDFFIDIPKSIRGNRHLYPDVFECMPALVSIPPNFHAQSLQLSDRLGMYEMDEKKLLDKSKPLDRLLLNSLKAAQI